MLKQGAPNIASRFNNIVGYGKTEKKDDSYSMGGFTSHQKPRTYQGHGNSKASFYGGWASNSQEERRKKINYKDHINPVGT